MKAKVTILFICLMACTAQVQAYNKLAYHFAHIAASLRYLGMPKESAELVINNIIQKSVKRAIEKHNGIPAGGEQYIEYLHSLARKVIFDVYTGPMPESKAHIKEIAANIGDSYEDYILRHRTRR